MRKTPLIFSILFTFAYAASHTSFGRVELQSTHTDAPEGCAACPIGYGRCVSNAESRVVKCHCPGQNPAVYDGDSLLENVTLKAGQNTQCGPGRWKVWDRNAGRMTMEEGQRLEHKARECRVFVDEHNELHTDVKLECVRGEFVYLPDALAVYSCKFGDMTGRLFVHANGTEATTSSSVTARQSDDYHFEVVRTTLRDRSNFSTGAGSLSSFSIENGIITIPGLFEDASKDFAVTGFYCIVEKIIPEIIPDVPHTYNYTRIFAHRFTNDLRAIDRVWNEGYSVATCAECKGRGQICYPNTDGNGGVCRCDQRYLLFKWQPEPTCENTPMMAWNIIATQLKPYACEPYVAERNKKHDMKSQWECTEGEFTYHNDMYGLYTCDSGKNKGYLFVHTRHEDNSTCESEHSKDYSIGVKSYFLAYERTFGSPRKRRGGSFYVEYLHKRIWSRTSDCLVIGFYCIVEKDKTTYSPEIPADLRIPREQRPDYRAVSNCTECFHGQVCEFSENINNYECDCPEMALSFYPNPRHHKDLSYNSEASCKNSYFIGHDPHSSGKLATAHMQEFPIRHKHESCEKYVHLKYIVDTHGHMTCFAGQFGYHPVHKGIYTCDFGSGTGNYILSTPWAMSENTRNVYELNDDNLGYLYIETVKRGGDNDHCQHDRTRYLSTGVKSFILHLEETARLEEKPKPHFIAKENRIFLDECPVAGLFCLKTPHISS